MGVCSRVIILILILDTIFIGQMILDHGNLLDLLLSVPILVVDLVLTVAFTQHTAV